MWMESGGHWWTYSRCMGRWSRSSTKRGLWLGTIAPGGQWAGGRFCVHNCAPGEALAVPCNHTLAMLSLIDMPVGQSLPCAR